MTKFIERVGVQLVQFLTQIILARVLAPSEFGIISLLIVFLNIASVFVESGLVFSLIRKKTPDEIDYSTAFTVSFLISIILYLLLFFLAPFLSRIFSLPKLTNLLRVMSVMIIIGSILSVQNAYVIKNGKMKTLLFSSLSSVLLSGIISIILALHEFGVWSLVVQTILYNVTNCLIYLLVLDWRPKFQCSINRAKELLSFGWKILLSNLLNAIYQDMRTFYIGYRFTTEQLAFYDRGKQVPNLFIKNVDGSIQTILLPVLSQYQNNILELKEKTRLAIRVSSYIIFPLMLGLFAIAEPLVLILLTDKWFGAIIFVQIFALTYLFRPIQTSNLQAINALGRSDVYLYLEITRLSVSLIILVITIPYGIIAIALGGILASFFASVINSIPNKRLIQYSYVDQIKDVLPNLAISLFMLLCIYPLKFLIVSPFILLLSQLLLGIFMYFLSSLITKNSTFKYLINMIFGYSKAKV